MENKENIRQQLDKLNQTVEDAIEQRTIFLNENMWYFADFKIGEQVYNVQTGESTTVKEHYRYWASQNPYYDTSLYCDCIFSNGDNTSRYGGDHPYILLSDKENKTDKFLRKLQCYARK